MNRPSHDALSRAGGALTRAATFDRRSIDEERRTVELSFSSEEPVERWWGIEVLGHKPAEADLAWLASGRAPLLADHDPKQQIGVVLSARIGSDRKGRAVVRFGRSARAEQEWQDVVEGIRQNVSVGYQIDDLVLEREDGAVKTYRATKWTPLEVSFVSVPADESVGVGRSREPSNLSALLTRAHERTRIMEDQDLDTVDTARTSRGQRRAMARDPETDPVQIERERVRSIQFLGGRHQLKALTDKAIADGTSVDAFRAQVLDELEKRGTSKPLYQPPSNPMPDGREVRASRPVGGEFMRETETGALVPIGRRGCDWKTIFVERDQNKIDAHEAGDLSLADFVRGVARMKTTEAVTRALSVGTDTAGGFTVPTVLMPEIFQALVPRSSLLEAGVGVVPAPQGAKSFNYAAINAIPTAAWRNEAGAIAESDPTFRNISITPRSLSFFFKISRELMADSPNIEEALRTAIAQAFAREMDRAGLRGTGTAPQPRGLLNVVGVQAVTNGTNGASLATLRFANLLSAYQAIRGADAPAPTAAIMAPRSLVGFASLADTTNQPLQTPRLLQDVRMLDTSQIPVNLTVGTSTDCTEMYLGDFRWASFFMREDVSIQLATELYAGTGEIGFFCHVRADFMVTYPAAFAVVTGVRP
jgi:HK97 family phage major capsid protein